jgi:GntR family transcriptional repressor for pyruvate dehydrogenase complex
VKVLGSARVLDVRRGDGTYFTSLAPRLLLEGLGVAVELAIYRALRARDQLLAQASALIHVNTSESWLRAVLSQP